MTSVGLQNSRNAPAPGGSKPSGALPKWLEWQGQGGTSGWRFLVHQRDGLGARLSCLINALALARRTGGTVELDWPPMTAGDPASHAMGSVSEIFAPAFVERHRGPGAPKGLSGVAELGAVRDAIQCGKPPPQGVVAVRAHWRSIGHEMPQFWTGQEYRALCRAAFDSIAFVPALEAARRKAAALPLPARAVGVHLRAGDVIYGDYRTDARMVTKAISYPVAEAIVAQERAARHPVILFGEDRAFMAHLAKRHAAKPIADMVELAAMSKLERAIFEITLMTRLQRLHAGQSAFAGTAALAGPVQLAPSNGGLEPDEIVSLIRTRLAADAVAREVAISGRQTAFACRVALRFDRISTAAKLEPGERLALIDLALRHDAFNAHLHIVRAAHCYAEADPEAADAALAQAAVVAPSKDLRAVLRDATQGHGDAAGLDLRTGLEAAAAAGRPMAAFVLAVLDTEKDRALAASRAQIFLAGRPSHLACLEHHVGALAGTGPAPVD
ncbi:hypothetical protein [Prosthecodimorpha staleyi]|uniref:Uncharacterized protein n=1 Tax=Prosthecodimorpha staleyi TaxID=2840188 RepID=A0A947D2G0_9HYPH|nr:hypothetical protein [Prosthecodimorpha staleyi]MBT9289486.1 hypothetical protein [Prosthecodimorpha staleyi]